ncbi:MAG: hypothetical protein SV186_04280 [Candidatus Nanohaloarchaea archaeon]|nr:hypothetical protein [Candidatus Nanohaloarchaea archaeon]
MRAVLIKGDGIGKDVVTAVSRVVEALDAVFEFDESLIGGTRSSMDSEVAIDD